MAHVGQLLGLRGELTVRCLAELAQDPAGVEPRRAHALSHLPQWLACLHRAPLGHAFELVVRFVSP